MDALLYITAGVGLALAVGLRPFLPALLAGALAGAHLGLDFDHTRFSFLASDWFLLAVTVGMVLSFVAQRRLGAQRLEAGPLGAAMAGLALGLGALLFGATLAEHHDPAWPGLVAGLACAALAQAAARGLLTRTRSRLEDHAAREALSLYLEAVALVVAGLAVLAPPVSLLVLGALIWLMVAARRRSSEKYAGLRVLR